MIINSVIAGKGGGDEVEAYALGDAKNAVKDDKVTLNFSANMATIEPSLSQGPSGSPYYPGAVSLVVGKYLYTLNTVSTSATVIRWEKDSEGNFVNGFSTALGSGRNTSTKPIGPGVRYSYYGMIHQFTEFGNVFGVITSGSTDTSYEQCSMSQDGNVIMASSSTWTPILLTKESGLFIKNATLENPDGVIGVWAFTGKKEGSKYYAYVPSRNPYGTIYYVSLDLVNKSIEKLATTSVPPSNNIPRYPVCFKNKLIYWNTSSIQFEVYTFSEDGSLTYSEEDTGSFRAVASRNRLTEKVGFVQDGYLICSDTLVGYNQTRIDYKEGRGFFEVASPFQDKEGGNVNYIGDGYAIWCDMTTLPGNPGNSFIRRYLAPIDQPYVATEPITGQFYANQTLTGIVKENNNGILKVSTVEDPNNPPPAVPDEAGLKTVINYGGEHKLNTTTAGSPTVSGTSYTNFTSNTASVAYAALTDSFKTASPEKIEAVVNFIYTPSDYETVLSTLVSDYTLNTGAWSGYSLRIKNGVMSLNVAFAGGTLTLDGTTALEEGASYAAKFIYNKNTSSVELFLSKDGGSFVSQGAITGEGDVSLSRVNYITFGKSYFSSYAYYNYIGTINLKGSYLMVNSEVWNGTKIAFGSVGVGYGYFKNTYFYPLGGQASDDKYVPYDGGVLTEDNIWPKGSRATTMNIVLGRNADMGSWTSDTEGYLSTQDSVAASVNKKLSTPVYLWHDLSYITPVVPETIEAVVALTSGDVKANVTVVGSPTISGADVSDFTSSSYVHIGKDYKSVSNAKYVLEFTTGASISSTQNVIHCDYLLPVYFQNSTLRSYSWGNGSDMSILDTPAANTRYRVEVVISDGVRYFTVTNLATGSVQTTEQSDSLMDVSANYNITFGVSSANFSAPFGGVLHLDSSFIEIGGVRVWTGAVQDYGTVSLPASWKTLDGVIYEYPNGFPTTQASDLSVNVVEGSNNLYATRTGDSCGLAISSTSPAGVDSSAVIGTVELDANGAITSYTPGE